MEDILTNPWFILFTVINIAGLIFLIVKLYSNRRYEPLLFDRLRDAEINISIKKPIHPSGLNDEKTVN